MKVLLEAGPNSHVGPDKDGYTCMDFAKYINAQKFIKILEVGGEIDRSVKRAKAPRETIALTSYIHRQIDTGQLAQAIANIRMPFVVSFLPSIRFLLNTPLSHVLFFLHGNGIIPYLLQDWDRTRHV